MISRFFNAPNDNSYFLLGPRGTGKSYFVRNKYPKAIFINLLSDEVYQRLLANPSRLQSMIPSHFKDWVVIDEIQKIPSLLDEVHRLIEERKLKFVLTGSSARKLKKSGANLLAGRAYSRHAYPLSAMELGELFNLKKALNFGLLPQAYLQPNSKDFISSYVVTYLKEEIQQEGLVRNMGSFSRFLEAASFSQAQIINYSNISSECSVERKTVMNYFTILEDLLLSKMISVFSLRAKRELIKQKKFYIFDVGVFRQIRPRGPLDSEQELMGACVETLVLQELIARNEYQKWDYEVYYWHTRTHIEVDFIVYGERGLKAIEVKSGARWKPKDFEGLLEFKKDYPKADLFFVYGGDKIDIYNDVKIIPLEIFMTQMDQWI